jgi:hypothetical protein
MKEFNSNFLDFFKALNFFNVDYIVVGGYAVGFYGYYRYTADLDILVRPVKENIDYLFKAFEKFGAPTNSLDRKVFLQKPTELNPSPGISFGREPIRLEIIAAISGVSFDEAWENREVQEVQGIQVNILNVQDLIKNKLATNRLKDKIDIEELEKRREKNDLDCK